MSMKKCKECGKKLSSTAMTCPSCGCDNPVHHTTSDFRGCMIFIAIIVILLLMGQCSSM